MMIPSWRPRVVIQVKLEWAIPPTQPGEEAYRTNLDVQLAGISLHLRDKLKTMFKEVLREKDLTPDQFVEMLRAIVRDSDTKGSDRRSAESLT